MMVANPPKYDAFIHVNLKIYRETNKNERKIKHSVRKSPQTVDPRIHSEHNPIRLMIRTAEKNFVLGMSET
jgi:hypothetical protein